MALLKNGGFKERIDVLLNDFDDFLNPFRLQKVKYFRPEKWKFYRFYDTKTKLVFVYDFPKDMNFTDGFAVVARKYKEKIDRWKSYFCAKDKIFRDIHVKQDELNYS